MGFQIFLKLFGGALGTKEANNEIKLYKEDDNISVYHVASIVKKSTNKTVMR